MIKFKNFSPNLGEATFWAYFDVTRNRKADSGFSIPPREHEIHGIVLECSQIWALMVGLRFLSQNIWKNLGLFKPDAKLRLGAYLRLNIFSGKIVTSSKVGISRSLPKTKILQTTPYDPKLPQMSLSPCPNTFQLIQGTKTSLDLKKINFKKFIGWLRMTSATWKFEGKLENKIFQNFSMTVALETLAMCIVLLKWKWKVYEKYLDNVSIKE